MSHTPPSRPTFDGFPHGKFTRLPMPPTFFSDLLPQIDDLAELKVTLFCFHALTQREKTAPYLRLRHFLNDTDLVNGLKGETAVQHGIAKAVARGTLLCAEIVLESGTETLYFVNTPKGKTAIEQIQRGNWRPTSGDLNIEILPERPNIYTLYEKNIGILTPHIAEELKDAEKEFPFEWVADAIREATLQNKRSWRYILAILSRWKQEGRTHETIQRHSLEDDSRYANPDNAKFFSP